MSYQSRQRKKSLRIHAKDFRAWFNATFEAMPTISRATVPMAVSPASLTPAMPSASSTGSRMRSGKWRSKTRAN